MSPNGVTHVSGLHNTEVRGERVVLVLAHDAEFNGGAERFGQRIQIPASGRAGVGEFHGVRSFRPGDGVYTLLGSS